MIGTSRPYLRKPATLLALALGLAAVVAGPSPAAAADRVVLVSWDGIRRDVLHDLLRYQGIDEAPEDCPFAKRLPTTPQPCGGYLSCLPNICEFQIIDSNDVEGKPLTRPQHAQMLTGYGPPETGIVTNTGSSGVPLGLTLYEHLYSVRPEVFSMHIAGSKYVGRGVTKHALESGALGVSLRRGARDRYTGSNTTGQVVVALDEYLAGRDSFFLFIHYKAADVVGHRAGDRSQQYREAIIADDNELGNVLALLEERGLLEGTKVYVTTDHGFDRQFHVNSSTPSVTETWLASRDHDLTAGPSTPLDVTPTILDAFGIDTTAFSPPYRGQSRLAH